MKRVYDSRNKVRGRTVATVVNDRSGSVPVVKAEPLTDVQRQSNPLHWTLGPEFKPDLSIAGLGGYRTDKKGRTLVTSGAVNYRDSAKDDKPVTPAKAKGPVTSL